MIKLETKTALYTACNNGSSSIVTKDGELYMFGKDAIYSDSTCESTGLFLHSQLERFHFCLVTVIKTDERVFRSKH